MNFDLMLNLENHVDKAVSEQYNQLNQKIRCLDVKSNSQQTQDDEET